MKQIKEFLAREDVIKSRKLISYIVNPIITVFCVFGILIMIIGNFGVIKEEGDRKDNSIMFCLNHGDYVGAYETYFLQRSLYTVSGEEFRKFEEFYNFYDDFVMSRIKQHAGKSEEAAKYVDSMQNTLKTSDYFEMKPIYEHLLSIDEGSFR